MQQIVEYLTKDSDEFGTPLALFEELYKEFHFTIDVCASRDNFLLPHYWTKIDDSLNKQWKGHRVWCNPPYSRGNVKKFFFKALLETQQGDCPLVVLLIPTYTERDWFHQFKDMYEVRFIRGRIKFRGGKTTARGNHMLLIFKKP